MIAFVVDQNFNERIADGMTRREASLQFTHVRDVDLATAADPVILQWAAERGLVLLTHDRKPIPAFARGRIEAGLPVAGVFAVNDAMPIGQAIDELLIAAHCLTPEETKNVIRYFPL